MPNAQETGQMQLDGKVAVITGGASGIGKATALAMAQRGADIVLADINGQRLIETQQAIAALGRNVSTVHCDVSRDRDVEQLAATALAKAGHVDILFNNAGVICRGALEELSIADWEWQFGINVFGAVRGIKAFLPHMIERGSGYIINTGSVAGLFALTGEGAPYIASKFAVVGLSEALALYARPRGIGVSVLCPGSVDTNLIETRRSIGMTPEREVSEAAQAKTVQGNTLMTPEQIGALVVEAVEQNRFFILADPAHQETLMRRTADWNAFLEERLAALGDENGSLGTAK
jgi:NAD(P)-dependent dehydrogenase (short-subunit alcohol dehydrogenase family)